jgi:hypothetical protein
MRTRTRTSGRPGDVRGQTWFFVSPDSSSPILPTSFRNREPFGSIPEILEIETFPFSRQPKLDRKRIMSLYDGFDYMTKQRNIIWLGKTGCGKTGLATSFLLQALDRDLLIQRTLLVSTSTSGQSTSRLLCPAPPAQHAKPYCHSEY